KAVELRSQRMSLWMNRGAVHESLMQPEAALKDYDRASEVEPTSPMPYVWKARIFFGEGQIEKGADEVRSAIARNKGDLGQTFEPQSGVELSADALRHGEEQIRKMLHDRPAMAEHVEPGSEVWNWAVRKFAGEDLGSPIDWDAEPPRKETDGQTHPMTDTRPAAIHVAQRSSDGPADRELTFGELWAAAVFELHNALESKSFVRLNEQALEGKLSREEYVIGYCDVEERSAQRTRAFYLSVFLPWARSHGIDTSPDEWYCNAFYRNRRELIASWKADSRWEPYGIYYDLTALQREYTRENYANADALLKGLIDRQSRLTATQLAEVHCVKGLIEWRRHSFRSAADELETAYRLCPRPRTALMRGQVLAADGRYEEAIKRLNEVIDSLAEPQ